MPRHPVHRSFLVYEVLHIMLICSHPDAYIYVPSLSGFLLQPFSVASVPFVNAIVFCNFEMVWSWVQN